MNFEPDNDVSDPAALNAELVKFGALVLVLVSAVLVVALTRPLLFDQIIPAVLGTNQPAPAGNSGGGQPTDIPTPEQAPTEEPATTVEPTPAPTAVPEVEATAPPARTHTVQPGENLSRIADQYGVTVEAIIAVNELTDPNRIIVGTVLKIPDR